jgi:hypothetical protein
MFDDLNENDIVKSINELIKEGNLRPTQYSVWYQKHLISPATIISKAHKIKEIAISRRKFNTDVAQKRLLELGFPIVGFPKDHTIGFFSSKVLNSFRMLAKRSVYDKNNIIDINIGKFLNQVPWEQTRIWAKEIEKDGWKIEGGGNWNEQRNNKTGQGYKGYTWYRVFPDENSHELLYFTIGIHGDGSLLIKLDIERSHDFFNQTKQNWFDNRKKELGANWLQINPEKAEKLSLQELVNKSIGYFNANLKNYYQIISELWADERLMRITWNTNNWESPIKHKWKKSNQGNHNIAYENQYGYGHEEWLFNPRYRIDGIQYGYIKGIEQMSQDDSFLDKIHLFTIDSKSKDRYLIAKLTNVEIINDIDKEPAEIGGVIKKYFSQMIEEVRDIKGDYKHFKSTKYYPNVKFNWSDSEIYNKPYITNSLKGRNYNRFMPYHVDEKLKGIIEDVIQNEYKLVFKPGKAKTTKKYTKQGSGNESIVTRSHSDITDDLYLYLKNISGYSYNEVSIEKSKVGEAIVDVLVKKDDQYMFFEVKTKNTAVLNIREALGQLFEYALMDNSIKVNKLVIVGPAQMQKNDLDYFKRLQKVISKPLEYWAYSYNADELFNKFSITF